ncbi:Uncharacterized conserved protein, contains HEPN domain [Dethiosulfatibacter aminovorans DSM 17477]|uniref:Uncharacterized conserved protein, contains HEPN domain n=1 Tax=Dethiosulfatibacter aminovorans DSM 17477 TaxID=1121476 RepID=A0A1M6N4N8_9FIRM|nr:DUF86 domain-containing protein [Dethiosulfatibacter aminovorans]SHJ90638.1 Uncharacterized conserved protein, contains HEPN domain [Dethiosulfatibacter aminovorans DSM 17477]
MNRDLTYIQQIIDAINKVEAYTSDGKDQFLSSSLIQDAVIRNIEIIGEISKRVSQDFRTAHFDIPWRKMAGIRDVLIHDYDSIDLGIVWNVVEIELPKIKLALKEL